MELNTDDVQVMAGRIRKVIEETMAEEEYQGRNIVNGYLCLQCGDLVMGKEFETIGRDDCDEGYARVPLPAPLIEGLMLRGWLLGKATDYAKAQD